MAEFDIDAALRWFRFNGRKRLLRRPDGELPFVDRRVRAGPALLIDTCVYIDQLRGRFPDTVAQLFDVRPIHHSLVSIQELMFGLGRMDPADKRTPHAVAKLQAMIQSMQPHRTFAADPDVLGRAALMGGLLARSQGYTSDNRRRAVMDATLFLQAHKLGLTVLTRNIGDFDLMSQLIPTGRALFYRIAEPTQSTSLAPANSR